MSSPIGQFPIHIVEHCVKALRDRYDVVSINKAQSLYLTHHGQLVRGEGTLLYTRDPNPSESFGSMIFRVESGGVYYYPVRVVTPDRSMTVTYLSPAQVLNNLIGLYVTECPDEANLHGLKKRMHA